MSFRGDTKELDSARSKLTKISEGSAQLARGLGIVGGAITAASGLALSKFIPFEDSLAKIRGLVGVANDELAEMEPLLHDIGIATGVGPQSLAEALFFVTSNGLRGAEAMEVVERSAKAQAIGLGEAATSARLATSAINAYGSENLSATSAFDSLTAAVRLGNLETEQMAGSMGRLIPIASGLDVEFSETAGLMAALSRTGTDADQAVTQLTQIMVALLNPTAEADKALESVGLSAKQARDFMGEEGLLNTLVLLRNTFGDNEDAMTAVFGNVRALRGVFDLLGPNLETTQSIMAEMTDTAGELDGAFERSDSTGREMRQGMATIGSVLITVGDILADSVLPYLETFVGWLQSGKDWLDENEDAARILIPAISGLGLILLVAAGALGFLALAASTAAGAMACVDDCFTWLEPMGACWRV